MRIACIGNMNNMMFPICLYLLDEGHEVSLFYLDEYDHFKPDPGLVPEELEIIDLGWNEACFSQISKKKVSQVFESYHFFIGTDYAAAYLSKAKIRIDIYMPAGSDLFDWPFRKFQKKPPEIWEINKVKCARNQLFGIRNAHYISLDYTHPLLEKYLVELGNRSKRIPVLPFVYFGSNGLLKLPSHDLKENQDETFKIFQHSRQAWKYDSDNLHHKGNEKLIHGFALFVKENDIKARLILLEYGEHVKDSKALINELGIASYVEWIPKMHKDQLFPILEKMDLCVGNLQRSFVSYGSVYEALASGVAFMGNRKDELYTDQFSELYPMVKADTREEVARQLLYFYNHRAELKKMGEQGYTWLRENAINPSVNSVLQVVNNHSGRTTRLPVDWKLLMWGPYFLWIRLYNFFLIKVRRA